MSVIYVHTRQILILCFMNLLDILHARQSRPFGA
jgi:hypothetical protein